MFLAIFPLQLAIFPGEEVPLHIFEPRYRQLIVDCRDAGVTFGIPAHLNGRIARHGTEVRLKKILKTHDSGEMDIIVEGIRIFEIEKVEQEVPGKLYSGAKVHFLPVNKQEGPEELREDVIKAFNELQLLLKSGTELKDPDPVNLSWHIAPFVGLPLGNRVEMLSMEEETKRLEYLLNHIERFNEVLDKQQTEEEAFVAKRDYILNTGNRLN